MNDKYELRSIFILTLKNNQVIFADWKLSLTLQNL